MQKLSETVYSSLFWLFSGLLVWLVIVPVALICLPAILVIAVGRELFKTSGLNPVEEERESQTNPENRPANTGESLLTSLLITILVEAPALLAAIISLQPTRLITQKQVSAQMLQPQPAKSQRQSSTETTDSIEVPTQEKITGN